MKLLLAVTVTYVTSALQFLWGAGFNGCGISLERRDGESTKVRSRARYFSVSKLLVHTANETKYPEHSEQPWQQAGWWTQRNCHFSSGRWTSWMLPDEVSGSPGQPELLKSSGYAGLTHSCSHQLIYC